MTRFQSSVCWALTLTTLSLLCALRAGAQDPAAKLDEYLTTATQLGRFSGSVLVAREGTILLSKGYGMANQELDVPNTPQTKFRIGSVTKTFTAAGVLLLQERGRLSVQDPVCKYLTDCPDTWGEITLHHLLTHTSGIPDYLSFPDYFRTMRDPVSPAELIARFRDRSLDFPPGREYRYSNSGYILLGQVIARASGQGYAEFLRQNIFLPLKMLNTGYDLPVRVLKNRASGYSRTGATVINAPFIATAVTHSAGALFSTVEDLYLWDQGLYTDRPLGAASRAAMFTAVKNDYGYGWGVGKEINRRNIAHTGMINGFTAILSRFPDERLIIIVLTNSDHTAPGVRRVARDLAAIVLGEPYDLPRARASVAVAVEILDSYVGEYEVQPGSLVTITRIGARLAVQTVPLPPYDLVAESETRFYCDVLDTYISFVRDEAGRVTELVLHQRPEQKARKVK